MRIVQVNRETIVEKVWSDKIQSIATHGHAIKLISKGKKPLVMLFASRQAIVNLMEILDILLADAIDYESFSKESPDGMLQQLSLWPAR